MCWVSSVEDLFADGLDPLIGLRIRVGHEPVTYSWTEHLETLLPFTNSAHFYYVVNIDEGFGCLLPRGSFLVFEYFEKT